VLRLPSVQEKTGLRRSAIYTRMAAGAFPRPISLGIGMARGWVEEEIDDWIRAQISKRDGGRGINGVDDALAANERGPVPRGD
jgi:prophage regulatory protein